MRNNVLIQELMALESVLGKSTGRAPKQVPKESFQSAISSNFRKRIGFFPTHQSLADELAIPIRNSWKSGETVLDPSCGAGDLLLAFAPRLLVRRKLSETLKSWGAVLRGYDKIGELVKISALRIAASAMRRGAKQDGLKPRDVYELLPGLAPLDFIHGRLPELKADYLLMNPPFIKADSRGKFGFVGSTNASALFVERAWKSLRPKRLRAVLPEVLRAGSRYEKWRTAVDAKGTSVETKVIGKFSDNADVDVFVLDLSRNTKSRKSNWSYPNERASKLGDVFDVSVGPMVPFRLNQQGPWMKLLDTSNATPWGTLTKFGDSLRFQGRGESGEFIVIRRTSSPDDKRRIVATWIRSKREVLAVENHLIVLRPKAEIKRGIEELFIRLKEDTNLDKWLNKRLRCRHLTVRAIKSLPVSLENPK